MAVKLKSSRTLIAEAMSDFWRWKKPLIAVVAILALPLTVLGALGSLNQDPTFTAYSSFLTIIMNLALLWAIVRKSSGQPVTLRGAYYEGTGSLVRFLILAFVLALMLVPFALGSLVYINGVTGATLVASNSEKAVLGLVWVVFALPSLVLIARYILSIFIVIQPEQRPFRALHQASALVKGRTFRVAGRLMALGILVLFILTVPTVIATSSGSSLVGSSLLAVVQVVSTLVVLPISNLYLYRLYQALQAA